MRRGEMRRGETRRGGDKEKGRQGEGETRRGGDKERGRQGEGNNHEGHEEHEENLSDSNDPTRARLGGERVFSATLAAPAHPTPPELVSVVSEFFSATLAARCGLSDLSTEEE